MENSIKETKEAVDMVKQPKEFVTMIDCEFENKRLSEKCARLEEENIHLKEALKHLMYAIH